MNEMMSGLVNQILLKGQLAVLVYFLAVNGWYLVLLLSSLLELRRHMLLITDESRHLRMVGPAEAGGHRAHRWESGDRRGNVAALGQGVARLHGRREVIHAGPAIDGTNDGQAIHDARLARELVTNADAGDLARD